MPSCEHALDKRSHAQAVAYKERALEKPTQLTSTLFTEPVFGLCLQDVRVAYQGQRRGPQHVAEGVRKRDGKNPTLQLHEQPREQAKQ